MKFIEPKEWEIDFFRCRESNLDPIIYRTCEPKIFNQFFYYIYNECVLQLYEKMNTYKGFK